MRRVLEAGMFLEEKVMLNELQRELVVDVYDEFTDTRRRMGFPEEQLHKYLKTGTLELSAKQELMKKQNCLDKSIASCFEIFNSNYDEEKNIKDPFLGDEKSFQKKIYYLMEKGKDAVINVSSLTMDSYSDYRNHRLINYFVKAHINGRMADEGSSLADMIMRYWRDQGLCLMNNVIITESPNQMLFVNGSLKAEAARCLIKEHYREIDQHLIEVIPFRIGETCQRIPGLKNGFKKILKNSFPVKIIKEEVSHQS